MSEQYAKKIIVKWLKRIEEKVSVSGKPSALYLCFKNEHLIFKRNNNFGFFMLTESHLRFFVDYPEKKICGSEYAFFDTQIKDITSICANYTRRNNWRAFFSALLLGLLCGLPLYFFPDMHSLIQVCLYLLLGCAAITAIGAFTYLRIKHYKIHIGAINGGFTLMGCQHRQDKNVNAWNQPMTIVYNATIIEENLIAFIEQINARISVLQERGEYAFDSMEVKL